MKTERLDKVLCALGAGTRSQVREMVRRGRVTVNGQCVLDSALHIDPQADTVHLDGRRLEKPGRHVLMLYKPEGILTAARDAHQRTVLDLLDPLYRSQDCMPAGRLDKATSGLLILTNDGELAHRLISPRHGVGKVYEAQLDGTLKEADIEAFQAGLSIQDADGSFEARPAQVRVLEENEQGSRVRVLVREGKYHQVRRMFASRGLTVLTLHRLAIGALRLPEGMEKGEYRELTCEEEECLWQEASL